MISIIIPTLNAEKDLQKLLIDLKKQEINDNYEIIVIDSSSTDKTIKIAKSYKAKIIIISKKEFNHGLTRWLGAKKARGDILVYLTQDVSIKDRKAIEKIVTFLKKDKELAAVYGRQLPSIDANPINAHLRLFNYRENSYITSLSDRKIKGIKKVFFSDSFSAYKKKFLNSVGGFNKIETSEDMDVAARLIKQGYKIGYCAEAEVIHSHNLSIKEEFERYKKIGKAHRTNKNFHSAKSESLGVKYVLSGCKYLIENNEILQIPEFIIRSLNKYFAYKIGRYSV
jgi:rhamnosyltransferase